MDPLICVRRFCGIWLLCVLVVACGGDGRTFRCDYNCNNNHVESAHSLVVNEGFSNPLGFYSKTPNFSWKLPAFEGLKSQTAYRIVVASDPSLLPDEADLWDSQKVYSDQSAWVDYQGLELESRQRFFWKIKFWDQRNRSSKWSATSHVEIGLLENSDWHAKWISSPDTGHQSVSDEGYHFYRPQYLRKEFKLNGSVESARLYITAKGVFEAQLNGVKVGNDVMTPGWTPYGKRIETLTYNVTELLKNDENTIGIILAGGWYSGRIAYPTDYKGSTPVPQVIAQLEVSYDNGYQEVIESDQSWVGTTSGPIRYSDIYQGEDYDANFELEGWSSENFDASGWNAVVETELEPSVVLRPKRHLPVRKKAVLPTLSVHESLPGRYIFDFGQNMVGVPELNIPVKRNQKVSIRYAEMLQNDGTLYTANYRTARSADSYVPGVDGFIEWKPKFTFHGFRYVEISGFDENFTPEKDWISGVVQYSDFKENGSFMSSNAKLNQLQNNIVWSLRGNFFDVPTDCPQRDERLGWTGDAQVFAPTSFYNADVHAFWASWLQSVKEEQLSDGGIPYYIPNNGGVNSSAGWADAATIIPWEIYLKTGDKNILAENYGMMKKLVSYYQLDTESRIGSLRAFGDWLQPFTQDIHDERKGDTPFDLINLAYFARSTQLTLNAALVLGYQDDVQELSSLFNQLQGEFIDNYLDDNGKLTTPVETQTGYLLALSFNLFPSHSAEKLVSNLNGVIVQANHHLRTGFLGTPLLAPTLHKYGHTDLVYRLLFQETYPSWFYSINQGATTLWERWDSYSHENGFGDVNMNSFNHYAYGAIGQWLYEGVGGISPIEPGFKKILISPSITDQLEYAEASYDSIYGPIYSKWTKTKFGLELNVSVPPNTTAKIIVPAPNDTEVYVGDISAHEHPNVNILSRNGVNVVLEVDSGTYFIRTFQN